jgi:hypothetical protein
VLIYWNDLRGFLRSPTTVVNYYNDDINDNAQKIRQDAQLLGEWEIASDGLALSSGHRGEVIYRIIKETDEDVILILWFYWNALRENCVEVSTDGVNYQKVLENTHMVGRSVRLTTYVVGHQEVWIRLTASFAETGSPETWTVLDKVQIVKIRNPIGLPYLPGIFLFIAIPLTSFAWARALRLKVAIGVFCGILIIEVLVTSLYPSWISLGLLLENSNSFAKSVMPMLMLYMGGMTVTIPWSWIIYTVGTATIIGAVVLMKRWQQMKGLAVGFLLVAIISFGFILRWEMMREFQYRPLDPDAVTYRTITDNMQHVYDTSFREPLWIWTIKLWFLLLGSSDLNLRLLSLSLSLLLLAVVYKLFKNYTGKPLLAVLVVILLILNPT